MSEIQTRLSDLKAKHIAAQSERIHAINSAIVLIGVLALFGIAAQIGIERHHQWDITNQESIHHG